VDHDRGDRDHDRDRDGGQVRIIDQDDQCGRNEALLVWSVTGPQGPARPRGPQGLPGPQGAQGAPGVSGWNVQTTSATNTGIPLTPGSSGNLIFSCPSGQKVLGGGCSSTSGLFSLFSSTPTPDVNSTAWQCQWQNVSTSTIPDGTLTIKTFAICANVQ